MSTSAFSRASSTSGKPKRDSPKRYSRRVLIGLSGRYLTLCLILVVLVGPIVWQFLTSLKGRGENVYEGVLPSDPTLDNYVRAAEALPLFHYVGNTLIVAVLAITSNCLFAAMGGYALSRAGWRGRKSVFTVLVATLMYPFESVLISMFLTVREMGLVDTLAGVWLPGAVSVINLMIMRAAFLAVPKEVEEAAVLDGANEWQRFPPTPSASVTETDLLERPLADSPSYEPSSESGVELTLRPFQILTLRVARA